MQEPIVFTVPAIPVAQPRPKATSFNGHARVYEAAKSHPVHAFKASVRAAAAAAYDGPPLEMALALTAVFVMPRPGSMLWKKRPMPRAHYCVSRNDWDNLGKSVSDALNGLVWRDDGQIVVARVERWIASGDEQPHVEIEIKPA